MDKLKLDKISLRSFGLTMGWVLLVIAGLFFLRHKPLAAANFLIASCGFFITGLVYPVLLKFIYIAWMHLAFILGWINTRIILVILFYLVFSPIGLLLRIFKVDVLETKNKSKTYWKKKEKSNLLSYERRF